MNADLLVSARGLLSRSVLLEDGIPVEFHVERTSDPTLTGNLYKGVVEKVLPGMEAAFVDIGLEKNAFLYQRDVVDEWQEFAELFGGFPSARKSSPAPGLDSILREGQTILVGVRRGERAGKGARLTTLLTLAGKYLVYLPLTGVLGISRRIEEGEERRRLRGIVEALGGGAEGGLIVRTAGQGLPFEDFLAERNQLVSQWQRVLRASEHRAAPCLLYEEPPLYLRLLRDLLGHPLHSAVVDEPEAYGRICGFLEDPLHPLRSRVRLYEGNAPLFEEFGVQKELDRALHSRVWLKSGGYLIIHPTEALTAIDVNSGKYVGRKDLNDTALKVNAQAAREVVRQIRLRDLGGIIVVDFIDMASMPMRKELKDLFEKELKRDRSRSRILALSDFGLLEMTRKRLYASLDQTALQACPYCDGRGKVKSVALLCQEVYEAVRRIPVPNARSGVEVRCHPDVAEALGRPEWQSVFARLSMPVALHPIENMPMERFEVIS